MKDTYRELTAAREVLNLPETTTLSAIKAQYRALLKQWHPDTCAEEPDVCHEMTQKIVAAYTDIMAYCNQYHIAFTREAMKSYLSPEERWVAQFGENVL